MDQHGCHTHRSAPQPPQPPQPHTTAHTTTNTQPHTTHTTTHTHRTHNHTHTPPRTPPGVSSSSADLYVLTFCETLAVDTAMSHVERALGAGGAALRRRERRLRSFWRHEQMAVQMVLATVTHHSFGKVGTAHAALRGQKQGTRTVQGEEHELYHTAKFRTTPLPAGGRPAPLSSSMTCRPCRPSMVLCRRWRAQFWISVVPWTCRLTSRLSQCPRSPLTVSHSVWWSGVSLRWWNSCLFQQTLEQIVDIPTSVHGVSGSLHGFPPEQSSAQRTASQIADIPVPGVSGSPQGFSPGQCSSQLRTASQIADIPVPGRGVYGSRLGFPPVQRSTALHVLRNAFLSGLSRSVLVEIFLLVVQVLTVLSQDRVQQLVLELMAMVEVFKALSQDRVPPLVLEMSERRCRTDAAAAERLPGVLQALGSSGVTGPLLL